MSTPTTAPTPASCAANAMPRILGCARPHRRDGDQPPALDRGRPSPEPAAAALASAAGGGRLLGRGDFASGPDQFDEAEGLWGEDIDYRTGALATLRDDVPVRAGLPRGGRRGLRDRDGGGPVRRHHAPRRSPRPAARAGSTRPPGAGMHFATVTWALTADGELPGPAQSRARRIGIALRLERGRRRPVRGSLGPGHAGKQHERTPGRSEGSSHRSRQAEGNLMRTVAIGVDVDDTFTTVQQSLAAGAEPLCINSAGRRLRRLALRPAGRRRHGCSTTDRRSSWRRTTPTIAVKIDLSPAHRRMSPGGGRA